MHTRTRNELPAAQRGVNRHRLVGVCVLRRHHPAWFVRADGQRCQCDAAEEGGDCSKGELEVFTDEYGYEFQRERAPVED